MAEKIMLCSECGRVFRTVQEEGKQHCPYCKSASVESVYRAYNLKERAQEP